MRNDISDPPLVDDKPVAGVAAPQPPADPEADIVTAGRAPLLILATDDAAACTDDLCLPTEAAR